MDFAYCVYELKFCLATKLQLVDINMTCLVMKASMLKWNQLGANPLQMLEEMQAFDYMANS